MPFLLAKTSQVDPLVKPTGIPTGMISNSLSAGMLYYVFDTGTGLYKIISDCTPDHSINPDEFYYNGASPRYYANPGDSTPFDPKQSLTPPESTPYGTAVNWGAQNTAGDEKPGGGSLTQLGGTDDIRTATHMALRSTGPSNGVTYFATHRTKGLGGNGLIFGRYSNPDSLSYINTIYGVGSDYRIGFGWSTVADSAHPAFVASTNQYQNVLCTTVVTLENPSSAGVTTIKMYCNGTLETTVTGTTVCDVDANTAFQEDQLQVGCGFHVFAGQASNNYNGNVYQAGIANRTWSAAEAASFATSPYQLLTF